MKIIRNEFRKQMIIMSKIPIEKNTSYVLLLFITNKVIYVDQMNWLTLIY